MAKLKHPESTPNPQKRQTRQKRQKLLKIKEREGLKDINKQLKLQSNIMKDVLKSAKKRLIKDYKSRTAPGADPLTEDQLQEYSTLHNQDPVNVATANALATVPLSWLAENRDYLKQIDYSYSHHPEHCSPPTNQGYSGRCWLFAALNTIRHTLIEKFKLNTRFELSEAYLFFYDKIERSYFFLEKMLELRSTPVHDVVVHGMMTYCAPSIDGGTWTFFLNLISRYGIVPKSIYGENFNSCNTEEMNHVLQTKLSQFATEIRSWTQASEDDIRGRIKAHYMPQIYSLMVKFLGEPPKKFDWNYHEAPGQDNARDRGPYRSIKNLTPQEYYTSYIEPDAKLRNKVLLRHDPRTTSPYYRTYHVAHFGAMVGGKPDVALNVPWEVLSATAAKAVMDKGKLWFSADVRKSMSYEYGVLSTEAFDYDRILNTDMDINKADGLDSRVSGPAHAMTLVGVDVEDNDPNKVRKWMVENSWGESYVEDSGYFLMTADWFKTYGYEVVVDLDDLDEETQAAFLKYEFNPIPLPYNDAFGAVAVRAAAPTSTPTPTV